MLYCIGKESAVLHAIGGQMTSADQKVSRKLPDECALKVSDQIFNNMGGLSTCFVKYGLNLL